jgi:hypothetical protein
MKRERNSGRRCLTSFFNKLFRYKATEKRTPLEDFLSEILVYFINQAPIDEANAFICNCFVPLTLKNTFFSICDGKRIAARTQVRITGNKCLDILLEIENQPLLIIENKIRAAFQYHMVANPADEQDDSQDIIKEEKEITYDHQLVTYGRWLVETVKPDQWPGIICVLTHASQPPQDFLASNSSRYHVMPHLQLWRNTYTNLKKLIELPGEISVDNSWRFVGRELCAFLEINEMSSSDFSPVEISSVNVAMGPLRKLNVIFAEVGAELLQRFPDRFVRKDQSSHIELENSRVWGWTYFKGPQQMYLAYGVCFSPIVGQFATANPPLADQEQVFIVVGSDKHAMNDDENGSPEGWSRLGDETWLFVKPFPLSNRHNNERFPEFVMRLIQENFEGVISILEKDRQIWSQTNGGDT